jgi:hypothetical protein
MRPSDIAAICTAVAFFINLCLSAGVWWAVMFADMPIVIGGGTVALVNVWFGLNVISGLGVFLSDE